jgi:ATP phosphoribosyltransferase regulatory subunit
MKDSAELLRSGKELALESKILDALVALPDLHGGDEIWARAGKALNGTAAEGPALVLRRLWDWVGERGIATNAIVDLGEISRFEYYTGVTFNILANGPGEALGSGGRYDSLFAQFNVPRPAAGFAVDLSNLCWAIERAGRALTGQPRVLVTSSVAGGEVEAVLGKLRSAGVASVASTDLTAADYARAWDYDAVLALGSGRLELKLIKTERTIDLGAPGDEWVPNVLGALGAISKMRSRPEKESEAVEQGQS